ncbi:MAG: hypothetical protein ABIO04_10735 [Ferruginibacter sp.]
MKVFPVILTVTLLINLTTYSQTAEDSVKAAVNNLFTAMKNSDSVLLKSCFNKNSVLQTIIQSKDNVVSVKNESVKDFIRSVSSQFKGSLDERITFDVIKIDGPLASVWTPYNFYYRDKFVHCGVNSFQLVKVNNQWKIQYLVDTRRKDGCEN